MAKLTFHGAARTVTGSRFLIEHDGTRILVDCGMFQGRKEIRSRNWADPGFDPESVDAVVLTHAHIDHSGYLPRLVKSGFDGPIHMTSASADLAELLLLDSARIQEEDAEYANRKGFSKHHPALPLYTSEDAERTVRQFDVVDYGDWQEIGSGIRQRFRPAGHILGSGIVEIDLPAANGEPTRRLLFSGDIGRYDAPLVPDPDHPEPCDVLVVESTYGDRLHPDSNARDMLAALVRDAVDSSGTVLIGCFAVGRAQQLLYLLHEVMDQGLAPCVPVHLDSPMAVRATRIYRRWPEEAGLEEVPIRPTGSRVLFGCEVFLHATRDESMRLNPLSGPRIILSASGMLTGGRVLHHLRRLLPNPENIIVLSGFQADGTRGRRLQNGEREIRIHGRDVRVRARVEQLSGLSGHADQGELMRWLAPLPPPRRTFVVHGEEDSALAFAQLLRDERGFDATVPEHGQTFDLAAAP